MSTTTLCERCNQWVAVRGVELCLDCGGLICPACQPTHTAHRVGDETFLTCRPLTDEAVRRMVEGDDATNHAHSPPP